MPSSWMDTVWRSFAKPLARPNISQQPSLQRLLKAKAYQVIKQSLFCIHMWIPRVPSAAVKVAAHLSNSMQKVFHPLYLPATLLLRKLVWSYQVRHGSYGVFYLWGGANAHSVCQGLPWFPLDTAFSSTQWSCLSHQINVNNSTEYLHSFSVSKQAKFIICSDWGVSPREVIWPLVPGAQIRVIRSYENKAVKHQILFELDTLVNCCFKLIWACLHRTNCWNFIGNVHIDLLVASCHTSVC